MAVLFSARQIVEAAIEKEKKRKGFYAAVSGMSQNTEMKGLFRFLAEEEERHIAAFSDILARLPADSHPVGYTEEMQAYMDGVINDRLYSDIDTAAFVEKALVEKNVFRLAIGFEKDAILYFREFVPFLSGSDAKVVSELIEQEKGHIRKLVEMKREMTLWN